VSLGPLVALALRLGLAALFLYAGISKMADLHGFAVDIANYRVLPEALVSLVAATTPGIEIVAGLCLLPAQTLRAAAWLIFIMLSAFTAAVAQALVRGINIECGCFGVSRDPVTTATLFRDLALLGGAALLLWLSRAPRAGTAPEP
jgi:uncharacterized membrane protein YphA (DoxX/SURF4 family)